MNEKEIEKILRLALIFDGRQSSSAHNVMLGHIESLFFDNLSMIIDLKPDPVKVNKFYQRKVHG